MGVAPALSARNERGGAGSFGVDHPAITDGFAALSFEPRSRSTDGCLAAEAALACARYPVWRPGLPRPGLVIPSPARAVCAGGDATRFEVLRRWLESPRHEVAPAESLYGVDSSACVAEGCLMARAGQG